MLRSIGFPQKFDSGFVILLWVIACLSHSNLVARAEPARASAQLNLNYTVQDNQTDPPDRGTPPAGQGTGSRGDCVAKVNSPPLSALVGSKGRDQTVSDRPTFWVYVPYTSNEAPSGEFSLQDSQGNEDLYRTQFQLPATPGIVSIALPKTVDPLRVGKSYRWYVEVNCPMQSRSRQATPASVTGLVKRVAIPEALLTELAMAKTPLQRAANYAKYGFWFDTVTEIALLRLTQPQNTAAKRAWMELLNRNDLQFIVDEAIIGRVTASSPPK